MTNSSMRNFRGGAKLFFSRFSRWRSAREHLQRSPWTVHAEPTGRAVKRGTRTQCRSKKRSWSSRKATA
eukprot:8794588-Pyramimonas_sp.AAC.1